MGSRCKSEHIDRSKTIVHLLLMEVGIFLTSAFALQRKFVIIVNGKLRIPYPLVNCNVHRSNKMGGSSFELLSFLAFEKSANMSMIRSCVTPSICLNFVFESVRCNSLSTCHELSILRFN